MLDTVTCKFSKHAVLYAAVEMHLGSEQYPADCLLLFATPLYRTWHTLAVHVIRTSKQFSMQTYMHDLHVRLPLCTIRLRIRSKNVANLCYAVSDLDWRCCKLVHVITLGVATGRGQGAKHLYTLAAATFHQHINASASEFALSQLCVDCNFL